MTRTVLIALALLCCAAAPASAELRVGLGEQNPAFFQDRRWQRLDMRYVRVVVAWCELREDYRHFRTDRIVVLNMTEKRYPRRRQAMLKEWREREATKEASER